MRVKAIRAKWRTRAVLYLSFVLVQKTSCLQLRVACSSLSSPTFERVLPERQRDFRAAAIPFPFYLRFCFWRYFRPALSSSQFVAGIAACHINQRRDKAAILYQQWLGYLNASIMRRGMRIELLRTRIELLRTLRYVRRMMNFNAMSVTYLEKEET